MRVIGNVLWLVLGGFVMALGYAIAGVIMFVLIITIPFGVQAFKLAGFALWPFGSVMVETPQTGAVARTIGNVLWVILGGWWLALGHLFWALLMAITIIGIPFAVAHFKLAGAAFVPFGRSVMSRKAAQAQQYTVVVGVEPLGG